MNEKRETRDDGVVMVEIAPWCWVNITAARIFWPQQFPAPIKGGKS